MAYCPRGLSYVPGSRRRVASGSELCSGRVWRAENADNQAGVRITRAKAPRGSSTSTVDSSDVAELTRTPVDE